MTGNLSLENDGHASRLAQRQVNRRPKSFILLVEIVDRELPASVLVGAELAERGHNVWLVEKGRFRKAPTSFPPGIVLEKGLSRGCLPRYRAIRRAGHVVAVMCQEGFIYRCGEDYIKRRVCAETIKNVDYLFLWGERQKNDLERFLGGLRGHYVTGNPRFDLLHHRFRKTWQKQVEHLRRQYGDFVLFTSRFAAVNHFKRSLDETLDRRKAQYMGGAEATVAGRFQLQQRLFVDYMKTIGDIAARLPSLNFIVRPHPIENADVWKSQFDNVSNVRVCDEGASIPWLGAARCVVHNACTTGIEAYVIGRPVIEYQPASIPRGEFDPVLPGQVTGTCDHKDALIRWIEANVARDRPILRDLSTQKLIGQYLQNHEQPAAYREIANAMETFRGPGPWTRLVHTLSLKRAPKQLQKCYIDLAEVNGLLRSYVDCHVRDRFVPAVADEVGIKISSGRALVYSRDPKASAI
jgi:surface carbohydrate biosynthesis protein